MNLPHRDLDVLDAVHRHAALPLQDALSLPPRAYTSEALLELELEHIFRAEWHCTGRTDELSRPGDYLTYEIAGEPVFVIRGHDNQLRGFANVCRHRLAQLLNGSGNVERIVCPYHAWTYDFSGQLVAAPFMHESFDMQGCRLPSLPLEVWQGWIYVSLNRDAPPLAPRLQTLTDTLANYRLHDYRTLFRFNEVWDTNWKCLIENFTDAYHLFKLHAKTVEPALPTRLTECVPGGEGFSLFNQYRRPGAAYEYDEELPAFNEQLTEEERRKYPLTCIYPGHLLGVSPDRLFWMSLQARGTAQVNVRWGIDVFPGLIADGPDGEARAQQLLAAFEAINDEDRTVLEGLRRNAASQHAQPGRLSPKERSIWEFMRYLSRRLGGDSAA